MITKGDSILGRAIRSGTDSLPLCRPMWLYVDTIEKLCYH